MSAQDASGEGERRGPPHRHHPGADWQQVESGGEHAHLASQSLISVVLRRLSSRSSAMGSGSFLWCSHHSRTCRRGAQGWYKEGVSAVLSGPPCRNWPPKAVWSWEEMRGRRRGGRRHTHLLEHVGRHVGERDGLVRVAEVWQWGHTGSVPGPSVQRREKGSGLALEHVLDEDRAVCDVAFDVKLLLVRSRELDLVGGHGEWKGEWW